MVATVFLPLLNPPPMPEPLHKVALHADYGPPITAMLVGQTPTAVVAADDVDQPCFVPCSLSGFRIETLRPISSSSLPPSLVSGRCTALFS